MDKYIEDLFGYINTTEIYDRKSNIRYTYSDGIKKLVNLFTKKKKVKSNLFFVGNGGSAAIASHMTADYMKNGGMNTYSLYDNAVMTCMGNDYGYEYVFSKPLSFLVNKGDVLVTISSSGESKNIINAIKSAQKENADIITFTGFGENNTIRGMGDINVYVPCDKYGMVESIHNLILQQIVDEIKERDGVAL